MANTYYFFLSDIADLETKISTLTTRINIDPEINPICLPVTVIYNDPNLEVSFSNQLLESDAYIVSVMVDAIFNNSISGVNYEYNNGIIKSRNVTSSSAIPTSQYDINSGYNIGSKIYNPTNNNMYVCLNSTPNASIWSGMNSPSNSTLPLNFSYKQSTGAGYQSSSNSWHLVTTFYYKGTNTDSMINTIIAMGYTTNTTTWYKFRIWDSTNNQEISISTQSNTSLFPNMETVFFGAITNLPTNPALMQLQMLATNTTGNTGIGGRQNIGIMSLQIYA